MTISKLRTTFVSQLRDKPTRCKFKIMTVSQLTSKLIKLNVEFEMIDINEFNKSVHFEINGSKYECDYTAISNVISDYSKFIGTDNTDQSFRYRFFDSFSQLIKNAQNN